MPRYLGTEMESEYWPDKEGAIPAPAIMRLELAEVPRGA